MADSGPFEKVYVENERYDGPRAEVPEIHNVPHRFRSLWDEKEDEFLSTFEVWPVSRVELELEIEQWRIFVYWNSRCEIRVFAHKIACANLIYSGRIISYQN